MRTVKYDIADPDELERAQRLLRDYATAAVRAAETVVTPLSAAQRFVSVSTSADPVAQSNVQVLEALNSLSEDVRKMARRLPQSRRAAPTTSTTRQWHRAERFALTTIIGRVVTAGRAEPDDWRHIVTDDTSSEFDDWARRQLMAIMRTSDEAEANAILMHPDATFMQEEEDHEDNTPPTF